MPVKLGLDKLDFAKTIPCRGVIYHVPFNNLIHVPTAKRPYSLIVFTLLKRTILFYFLIILVAFNVFTILKKMITCIIYGFKRNA